MKKSFIIILLLAIIGVISCQKEEMELQITTPNAKNNHEITDLFKTLEKYNENFILSHPQTKWKGGWFEKALIIAGADVTSTIGTLVGMGTAINIGIITPPGAITTAASAIIAGAGGSIYAANKIGVITFNESYTLSKLKEVGQTYISSEFPQLPNQGLNIIFPHQYEFVNFAGPLHNDVIKKCLGKMQYTPFKGTGASWEQSCILTYTTKFENRYIQATGMLSNFKLDYYNNNPQMFNNCFKHYSASENTKQFLSLYLNAYIKCNNMEEVKDLTQYYAAMLLSKKALFSEVDFQAILIGFSIAMKSPYLWAEELQYSLY